MKNVAKFIDANAAIGFACGVLSAIHQRSVHFGLTEREAAALLKAYEGLKAIDLNKACLGGAQNTGHGERENGPWVPGQE